MPYEEVTRTTKSGVRVPIYKKMKVAPGLYVNLSQSGVGMSIKNGPITITTRVNGTQEMHINFGNGLRLRKKI